MPKFAANLTMMFNEVPFLDRFARAAAAGFEAVECLFPYEAPPETVAARLKDNNLTVALFNLPPGDWAAGERGIAALPGREAEFRQGLETAKTYAVATGVRRVHMMAGLAPATDKEAWARYEAGIRLAAATFAPLGIDVLLEPLNRRDMPGYLLGDFDAAASVIERLGLPNVKLQFDIYHCQILHGDILKRLQALFPIIGHIQTASVPARNEPGTGELNDALIFAELDRLGYQGYIGCEYRPAAGTEAGLGWFAPYRPGTRA
jgi:hydroxypyruvate isomerase